MTDERRVSTRWVVLERSQDGLMKHPEDLFSTYGYESREEAVRQVLRRGYLNADYFILEYAWVVEGY